MVQLDVYLKHVLNKRKFLFFFLILLLSLSFKNKMRREINRVKLSGEDETSASCSPSTKEKHGYKPKSTRPKMMLVSILRPNLAVTLNINT